MYYVLCTMYYVLCTMYYVLCTIRISTLYVPWLIRHCHVKGCKKTCKSGFSMNKRLVLQPRVICPGNARRMTYVSPVAEMRSAVCCRTETVPGDLAVLEPWQHVCITIRTLVPTIACRCCQRRMTPNANTIASASIRFGQWLEQFKEHSATLQVTIQDTFKSKFCGEI